MRSLGKANEIRDLGRQRYNTVFLAAGKKKHGISVITLLSEGIIAKPLQAARGSTFVSAKDVYWPSLHLSLKTDDEARGGHVSVCVSGSMASWGSLRSLHEALQRLLGFLITLNSSCRA
jgi:hypothetical protein